MGAGGSPVEKRSVAEMSPAEFLADVEVAVTDRVLALSWSPRRSAVGVDGNDDLIVAAAAAPEGERNAGREG